MKKQILTTIAALSLAACATSGTVMADDHTSAFTEYEGVYAGTYICSRGENGITVSLDSFEDAEDGASASVEARLWFYDTTSNPNHPAGAFAMTGTISESGAIELTPGEWISEIPSNWGAAGIVGVMHTDEWTAEPTGPGTSECQYFRLSRLVGLD